MTEWDEEYELFLALMREDFLVFLEWAFLVLNPGVRYQPNWHIELIAYQLMRVLDGEVTRLNINLAPRSLKSITTTIAYPAWRLGHNPSLKILAASYGAALATEHAQNCRTLMTHPDFRRAFPACEIATNAPLEMMRTTARGHRQATSVNAPATGFGCDLLIVDDITKADASAGERATANKFFTSSLLTRCNNKGRDAVLVTSQRTATDDLPGHLYDQGGWEHINLPAIAQQDMLVKLSPTRQHLFKKGDVLHPERESREVLSKIRKEMGDPDFAAQYLQNPSALTGRVMSPEWFPLVEARYRHYYQRVIFSIDTALSDSPTSDYSVISIFGWREGKSDLADLWRKQCTYETLAAQLDRLIKQWAPTNFVIERSGYGFSLISRLSDRLGSTNGIHPFSASISKGERVGRMAHYLAQGHIRFVKDAPYLPSLLNEISGFPGGMHDDQVDTIVQYANSAAQGWDRFSVVDWNWRNQPDSGRLVRY